MKNSHIIPLAFIPLFTFPTAGMYRLPGQLWQPDAIVMLVYYTRDVFETLAVLDDYVELMKKRGGIYSKIGGVGGGGIYK